MTVKTDSQLADVLFASDLQSSEAEKMATFQVLGDARRVSLSPVWTISPEQIQILQSYFNYL